MILLNNEDFSTIKTYKKRKEYNDIKNYLNNNSDKILAVSGLRRTGKTVLLSQTFLDITSENCDLILIENDEPIGNLMKHIDNSNKKIFIIDEITRIRNIDDISILYDKYTKYGKKIIISGTESLLFNILSDYTLYNRVDILELLPLSSKEYARLIGGNSEEYLNNSGLFYGKTENLLLNISENIIRSLKKLDGDTTYYTEIMDSMIKLLLLKIVWTEELIHLVKFSPIGLRRDDVKLINEELISKIIKKTPEIEYTNMKDLEEVYNYLKDLKVVLEFERIDADSKIKKIIPIPGILTEIYRQIVKYCINSNIFISKRLVNGIIFEKEMNVQSYLRNPELPRYTLDTDSIEVDEIVETDTKIIVVDYKIPDDSDLILTRVNINKIEEIKEKIKKYFKKEIEYMIVYNGETKYNEVQFKNIEEFLNEIESISYRKEEVLKWI